MTIIMVPCQQKMECVRQVAHWHALWDFERRAYSQAISRPESVEETYERGWPGSRRSRAPNAAGLLRRQAILVKGRLPLA